MFTAIVRSLAAFGRVLPSVITDLAGLAGVGFVSYGAWLLNPAAGYITLGTLLVVGAVLVNAKNADRGP